MKQRELIANAEGVGSAGVAAAADFTGDTVQLPADTAEIDVSCIVTAGATAVTLFRVWFEAKNAQGNWVPLILDAVTDDQLTTAGGVYNVRDLVHLTAYITAGTFYGFITKFPTDASGMVTIRPQVKLTASGSETFTVWIGGYKVLPV